MEDIIMGGTWNVLGKEYNGDLVINEKEQRLGLILHCPLDMTDSNEFKTFWNEETIPKSINYIFGITIRNVKYTLVDNTVVKRNGFFDSHFTVYITSRYCITGITIDDNEVKFNKMKFKLSNTLIWTGLWGNMSLKHKELEQYREYREVIAYKYKESIKIDLNNTILIFDPLAGPYKYDYYNKQFCMAQDVEIRIEKKELTDIEEFIKELNIIKDFVTFTMRIPIIITDIKGNHENHMRNVENNSYYEDIKVYYNKVKKVEDNEDNDEKIITLNEITNKNTAVKNWFDKYEKLKEIVNFYNNNIEYANTPSYIRFINIAQALELYHTNFICKDLSQFNRKFEEIEECTNKETLNIKIKEIQNGTKGYVVFENRILDLLLVDFKIDFYIGFGSMDIFDFAKKVATTRHYFVHRDENKLKDIFSENTMEQAIYILENLLTYYVLKDVGVDREVIMSKINEKLQYIRQKALFNK